ncbi:MAG: hypothetical protein [Podoviridae sp. ctDWo9]|nr:MAG: hypothetical protein [Podoviridae sp. ctDWo9]
MGATNDDMFVSLAARYPGYVTLGDLLYQFWLENGLENRGTLANQFYTTALAGSGVSATTTGDMANAYWSDADYSVSNLEQEDGSDLNLENGGFILLEAGNG